MIDHLEATCAAERVADLVEKRWQPVSVVGHDSAPPSSLRDAGPGFRQDLCSVGHDELAEHNVA